MEITFKNKKFQKICHSDKELTKAYGKNCARKIRARLDDLTAASCLAILRVLPGRCHELKGAKKGQLSLDLEHPLRLIIAPLDENINKNKDGGLDWDSITAVKIIGVEDTHE